MTPQEQLHAVSTAIRKVLPRLMEPTEGCKIKFKRKYFSGSVTGRVIANYNKDVLIYSKEYDDTFLRAIEHCEIIGHDILLSDVLEWSSKTFKNFRKLLIDDDGILYKFLINGMFGDAGGMYWDLSKPRLADQSEELINFLYNLIKNN